MQKERGTVTSVLHDQQPAKHIKLFLLRCCLWEASSVILLDLL